MAKETITDNVIINDVPDAAFAEELDKAGMFEDGEYVFTPDEFDDELDVPFMPIGTIFASTIPQTDSRVHLLNGGTISQLGVYENFSNLLKNLVAAGYSISCTQAEFDNDVASTGSCGKFVIDNDTNTIRLPLVINFIAGLNDMTKIGKSELDSFKAHSHGLKLISSQLQSGTSYSRFASTGTYNTSDGLISTEGGDETKPKNVRYPYYIVLATGYKSNEVVNVDNILTELNSLSGQINDRLPKSGGVITGELRRNYNLLNFAKFINAGKSNGTVTLDYTNKTITMTSTASDQYFQFYGGIQLKPNTTYRFSMETSPSDAAIEVYMNTPELGYMGYPNKSFTFTTGASGYINMLRLDNNSSGKTTVFSKFMLSEGSAQLPYDDYKGEYITDSILNDYIIERKTTSTGYFRKWKSGFKESFGNVSLSGTTYVGLSEAFSNTNYQVFVDAITNTDDSVVFSFHVERATDAFNIRGRYQTGAGAHGTLSATVSYYACGY